MTKYDDAGVRLIGNQVRMAEDATSVTRRQGELLVTDGPYAESREWIVGFDVLECADLDEAIKVAAEHPMAVGGRLELRPFVEEQSVERREVRRRSRQRMADERLRIVASLIRTTRDWDLAEDAVADAAERALLHLAARRRTPQPGRLAHHHGAAPRARRDPAGRHRTHQARRARRPAGARRAGR